MVSGLPSPLLVGWLHPCILVPESSQPPSCEILLHELAHLRRRDLWWMTLGRVVGALWWFYPLAQLLARQVERSAEDVCDDLVVLWTADAPAYALQLVAFARGEDSGRFPAYAGVAVTGFRSGLGKRVARLLEPGRKPHTSVGRLGTALLTTSIAAMLGVFLVAVPRQVEADPDAGGKLVDEIHVHSTGADDESDNSKDILPATEAVIISGLHKGMKFDDLQAKEAARRLLASGRFEYVRVYNKGASGSGIRVEVAYTPKLVPTDRDETTGQPNRGIPTAAPGVAASVNAVPILVEAVDNLSAPRARALRTKQSGGELAKQLSDLWQGALQDLIDRELILQEFARRRRSLPRAAG